MSINRTDFPPELASLIDAEAAATGIGFAAAVRVLCRRACYQNGSVSIAERAQTAPSIDHPPKAQNGSETVAECAQNGSEVRLSPRARAEECISSSSSSSSKTEEVETAPKRKRDAFLDTAWAIYDEVDTQRPTAGLLKQWLKNVFSGDSGWMLRALRDLAPRGALGKGEAYVFKALQGITKRGDQLAFADPDRPDTWLVGIFDRIPPGPERDAKILSSCNGAFTAADIERANRWDEQRRRNGGALA